MNVLILFLISALCVSVTGLKSQGCIRGINTRSKNAFTLCDSSSSCDGFTKRTKKDLATSAKKTRLFKGIGSVRKASGEPVEDVEHVPVEVDTSYRLRRPPPKVEPPPSSKKPKPEKKTKEAKMKEQAPYLKFEPEELAEEVFAANLEQVMEPTKTFADIGISDLTIQGNLETMGVFNPTKIQDLALNAFLKDTSGTGDRGRKELVLHAQTGSGKTLGFLLPLTRVIDPDAKKIQALIIAPSRELVQQIASVSRELFAGTSVTTLPLIGGTNVENQIKSLRKDRPQIIVATPGRLAELIFNVEAIRLGNVRAVIIDEIDSMVEEFYAEEIKTILDSIPMIWRGGGSKGQMIDEDDVDMDKDLVNDWREGDEDSDEYSIFDDDGGAYGYEIGGPSGNEGDNEDVNSCEDESIDEGGVAGTITMTENEDEDSNETAGTSPAVVVEKQTERTGYDGYLCFASATASNPVVMSFVTQYCSSSWQLLSTTQDNEYAVPTSITHALMVTSTYRAFTQLSKFLKSNPAIDSALIFVNNPHRVELLCELLLEEDIVAAPLHGKSSKEDRKEIVSRISDGRIRYVVTTEMSARGLDIPLLSHVINYELPTDTQHYIHRSGRCGRMGRPGFVMNFVNPENKFIMRRYARKLKIKLHDAEMRSGDVWLRENGSVR